MGLENHNARLNTESRVLCVIPCMLIVSFVVNCRASRSS